MFLTCVCICMFGLAVVFDEALKLCPVSLSISQDQTNENAWPVSHQLWLTGRGLGHVKETA